MATTRARTRPRPRRSRTLRRSTRRRTSRSRPARPRGPRTRRGRCKDLRLAREGKQRVAREGRRERPARGPAPRARAGSVDPRPVRGDRRPRPSQGHPGALPAVADEPAAARVPAAGHRPAAVRRRRRSGPRSARRSSSTAGSCRSTRTPGASFAERIRYQRLDFDDPAGFDAPGRRASTSIDEEHGTRGNHLFYLATQPSQFAEIVAQLGRVGLDHEHHDGGWRRVVIEKPFGHDLDSAKRLNREVGKVFRESQVYRIDHYLGKETVRNLLVFRFGNGIFEPLWNRRYVDHVQITVAESIGIENRGAFYEETGASRDVLQNHLLQLVSLVAMEPPATFEADALRDEKVKVLRAIEITPEDVPDDVVRGQYGPGWVARHAGPGLPRGARGRPRVGDRDVRRRPADDRRLALVRRPVLRPDRQAPAQARDRDRDPVPRGPAPPVPATRASSPDPNLLAIRIQPDEGIMLRFGAKVPGLGHRRPLGDDGLHLRLGVQRRLARRLRDAHPRRAPGRRLAVHPGRRGRGGVEHRRPDHRRVGGRTGARRSRTTTPAPGARPRPTS